MRTMTNSSSFPKLLQKLIKPNLVMQLLYIFAGALLLGPYIPVIYKSFAYSLSSSMKEILVFLLPIIIFSCLFNSLVSNRGQAVRFVFILVVMVCLSNFISIISAYFIGKVGLSFVTMSTDQASEMQVVLDPIWNFKLPTLIANEHALIAGLVIGLFFSIFPNPLASKVGERSKTIVTLFLQKVFVPLLPIFALGFIVKMEHEGVLQQIIKHYGPIIFLLFIANISYLLLMFGIAAKFNPKTWFEYIKNALPAGILGFSTMSSMATMPVTLNAAEKNTKNVEMARAIIPATVNIHMIGDSLSIPILAMAVMLSFGHSLPDFWTYLIFTQFFMITKFAVPGIPCGTIIIMIPVFEQYFGYTTEMSAFIAAIYILFDTLVTSANVLGNSSFVIILTRLLEWMKRFGRQPTPVAETTASTPSIPSV